MWTLESGYIIDVDIFIQDFWVICQHIGSSNSESTHWRESWFWNCWYESQCYWIKRKSKGLLFSSHQLSVFCLFLHIYVYINYQFSVADQINFNYLADSSCWSCLWGIDYAVYFLFGSWYNLGGTFSYFI